MVCKNCGLDNAEGTEFCNACGTQLAVGDALTQPIIPAAKEKERSRQKKYILSAIFIILGIVHLLLLSVFRELPADDYIKKGDAYYADREYDNAIAQYSNAIKLDEKRVAAYLKRAAAYEEKQEYDDAIANLNQVIGLDPLDGNFYVLRGFLYQKKGENEKALADYINGLKQPMIDNGLKAKAYVRMGNVYTNQKNDIRAIEDFTKAIEIDPKYADAYFLRGVAYGRQKQYAQAVENLTKAIEIEPQNATAFCTRGNMYSVQKQYAQAIDDYTKAIEMDPQHESAYFQRGLVYGILGQHEQEEADWLKVRELQQKDKK